VTLVLEGAVADFAESVETNRSRQGIMGFALVEAGVHRPSEGWISEPFQHKQGTLDSADLAEGQRQTVLTRIGTEFAEDQRGRYGTLLDRRGKADDLFELAFDKFRVEGATDQGAQRGPVGGLAGNVRAFVSQIADARREAEAEQVAQSEDVIGETGRVGIVLLDPQIGLVIQQPSRTCVASRTAALMTLV
jgi:hypothetical protein